jgi:hypothetical protein
VLLAGIQCSINMIFWQSLWMPDYALSAHSAGARWAKHSGMTETVI